MYLLCKAAGLTRTLKSVRGPQPLSTASSASSVGTSTLRELLLKLLLKLRVGLLAAGFGPGSLLIAAACRHACHFSQYRSGCTQHAPVWQALLIKLLHGS